MGGPWMCAVVLAVGLSAAGCLVAQTSEPGLGYEVTNLGAADLAGLVRVSGDGLRHDEPVAVAGGATVRGTLPLAPQTQVTAQFLGQTATRMITETCAGLLVVPFSVTPEGATARIAIGAARCET